jgi:orotate phosphoribosyltransferase
VTAAALVTGLPMMLIRNKKKDYGTARQIEGVIESGDRVMIVEDVATTGGQVIEAAQAIVEAGAQVAKIVAVIDRQEGAQENIEGAGFAFESLFTKADLGINE